MKIEALILSQFHQQKGIKIVQKVPENSIMTEEQFAIYDDLILPREQLCGHFIALQVLGDYFMLGVPSLSQNTKQKKPYGRSKYYYGVHILVHKGQYLNPSKRPKFVEMAKKLSHFFKFMEENSNTIYNNQLSLPYLKLVLQKVYDDINRTNQCVLSHFASCYTIINLDSPTLKPIITEIKKSSVPITYLSQSQINEIQSKFGRNLLKYAQAGDFNIKKICELMQNQSEVYRYYQKAMQMGLVYLVDMYSMENRYCLTPNFHQYLKNRSKHPQLLQICKMIMKQEKRKMSLDEDEGDKAIINPDDLLYLYTQFNRRDSVREVINNNLLLVKGINMVKWIRISEILGIIQRVYEKFAVVKAEGQQFEFISEHAIAEEINMERKMERKTKNLHKQKLQSIIRYLKQHEKLNSIFSNHVKNMDSIDQICTNLDIDKPALRRLINFEQQNNLKIFYVLE